jgi:putative redox protein
MKIVLDRVDDAFHFQAKNEDGKIVDIDGAPAIGGHGEGVRPMQMLIMGLGGCSGIDVVLILKKQKQIIEDLKIELDAERFEDQEPALFKKIHVTFNFKGAELNDKRVKRAVALSMDKYCSVAKILEETAEITYGATINGVPVE